MPNMLDRLFFQHPHSVDESYLEHFRFALGFGGALLLAGMAATVHALLPFLFETTASRIIKRLHARIVHRGSTPAVSPAQAPSAVLQDICPQI